MFCGQFEMPIASEIPIVKCLKLPLETIAEIDKSDSKRKVRLFVTASNDKFF
jgi:hypothetical protein